MKIVPLKKEHLDQLEIQGMQHAVSSWITPDIKHELERGMSFAAIEGDRILGCAGIVEYWDGRAAAWAMLSGTCGRNFVAIHRAVQRFLEMKHYRRLEATADIGFGPGQRWLQMLGFRKETECMKGYLPTGADATMYVRGV